MSETAKHREIVLPYCEGNIADLGSGGDPVVPWALQMDLPIWRYHAYNTTREIKPVQFRGDVRELPFKDGALDAIHASHVLEDFEDWLPVLAEWDRCLKIGGFLIIAVPDHERFRAYVKHGAEQGIDLDNLSHKHESRVGELTEILAPTYHVLRDAFVNTDPSEHSILFIGRKKAFWRQRG